MNNTITLPTMISVKQASAQFGLTPYFLRSLCHDGKIRYMLTLFLLGLSI